MVFEVNFMLLMLFTATYKHQWAHFTVKIHKWTLTLFLSGNRHRSINLAQHTVHGTRYTIHDTWHVGSTKKIEKKCDAWNSLIERKKGEMMNDFVEWLIMCVELINVMIEINICFLWPTRSSVQSPFSVYNIHLIPIVCVWMVDTKLVYGSRFTVLPQQSHWMIVVSKK